MNEWVNVQGYEWNFFNPDNMQHDIISKPKIKKPEDITQQTLQHVIDLQDLHDEKMDVNEGIYTWPV